MEKEKRINIIIEFRLNKRIMYLKRISVWPIPRKEYLCHSPLKNPLVSFISFCFLAKCFAIFRAGIKKRVFVPRSRGAKAAARATLAFLCHVHLACTCPPPTIHRQPPTSSSHAHFLMSSSIQMRASFQRFLVTKTLSRHQPVRLTYALLHTRYQNSKESFFFGFTMFWLLRRKMHTGKENVPKIIAFCGLQLFCNIVVLFNWSFELRSFWFSY